MDYSTTGDGVYYSNYNYYPDRWGVTYSNVYYSPFRYPRVGFYFSSGHQCGYSYWSTWCGYSHWPAGYRYSSWWPSWGYGLVYASYYDNYWWYNHWRNRNYEHYRPGRHGYNKARNEAVRLQRNNRYYRYNNRAHNNSANRGSYQRPNNRGTVDRSRNTGNRGTYRNRSGNSGRAVINRQRQQEAAVNQPRRSSVVSRDLVRGSDQPGLRSSTPGPVTRGLNSRQSASTTGNQVQEVIRRQHQNNRSHNGAMNNVRYQGNRQLRQQKPMKSVSSQPVVRQSSPRSVGASSPLMQRRTLNNSQPVRQSAPTRSNSNRNVRTNSKPVVVKSPERSTRKSSSNKRTERSKSKDNRSADRRTASSRQRQR